MDKLNSYFEKVTDGIVKQVSSNYPMVYIKDCQQFYKINIRNLSMIKMDIDTVCLDYKKGIDAHFLEKINKIQKGDGDVLSLAISAKETEFIFLVQSIIDKFLKPIILNAYTIKKFSNFQIKSSKNIKNLQRFCYNLNIEKLIFRKIFLYSIVLKVNDNMNQGIDVADVLLNNV